MNEDIDGQAFREVDVHLHLARESTLEIEILPSALCPPGPLEIQCEENCLGMPKALLVPAFKHALGILALGSRQKKSSEKCGKNEDIDTRRWRATAVVLLVAPEHLTAANIRKRYLVQLEQHHKRELWNGLRHELNLLDSFLTSPLHRHTKSPTLWSHRRWLVTHFYDEMQHVLDAPSMAVADHQADAQTAKNVVRDKRTFSEVDLAGRTHQYLATLFLKQEYEVVRKAGQQHPRNYVAYDYMRYIIPLLVDRGADVDALPPLSISASPGDTSTVSFIQFRLRLLAERNVQSSSGSHVVHDTIDNALQYKWQSEAVWSLVRVALSSTNAVGLPEDARQGYLGVLREWLGTHMEHEKHDVLHELNLGDARAIADTRLRAVVEKTVHWVEEWLES